VPKRHSSTCIGFSRVPGILLNCHGTGGWLLFCGGISCCYRTHRPKIHRPMELALNHKVFIYPGRAYRAVDKYDNALPLHRMANTMNKHQKSISATVQSWWLCNGRKNLTVFGTHATCEHNWLCGENCHRIIHNVHEIMHCISIMHRTSCRVVLTPPDRGK